MRHGWFVVLAAVVVGRAAMGQDVASLTPDDYVSFWENLVAEERQRVSWSRAAPATVGVVSGFGLGRGTLVFGGAATNARERGVSGDFDASFAFGAGFGDPRDGVGFDLILTSTSTGDPRDGLSGLIGEGGVFAEGSLGFKLSRELQTRWPDIRLSVAAGASNVLPWGTPSEVDTNYFVSATAVLQVDLSEGPVFPVNLTAGAGSAIVGLEREPGIFGGLGLGVSERISVAASWLGDELMLGATFYPLASGRMQVSVAAGDVTRRVSEGRIIVSIGYSWDGLY